MTDEQVKQIQNSFGITNTKLSNIAVGKTFKIGDYEFIVLEHAKETTAVILKNLLFENKEFGKNNNYQGSYVDNLCNDFAKEVSKIVGKDNLIEHTIDLTSDDGLKDYGKVKRFASLLTTDLYRRYVEILDKHKINKWWWLATPYSTPTHEDSAWIKCVTPYGILGNYGYIGNIGVRPFCIFNSDIFISCEE